jgi:hypothetical protein
VRICVTLVPIVSAAVWGTFGSGRAVFAYQPPRTGVSRPSRSEPPAGMPKTMRFCGPAHCGTLTWRDGQYDAVYDDNAGTSKYSVELFTPETVKMNRADSNGGRAELAGRITPSGNRIEGTIRWLSGGTGTFPFSLTWDVPNTQAAARTRGGAETRAAIWELPSQATSPPPPAPRYPNQLPAKLRFCGPAQCGTLTWSTDHYDALYDDGHSTSKYTVELFTPDSVKMRRVDQGGASALLTGRIAPEGNRILHGKITWSQGGVFDIRLSWASAFDGLPAGNCIAAYSKSVDAEDALFLGNQAFDQKQFVNAGCWWQIGATKGNTEAQFYLGIWYEYGQGGSQTRDHRSAMSWLNKAASAGEVKARVYLVCTSPNVTTSMKRLFEEAANDPQVRTMTFLLNAILGMKEHEGDYQVVDMSPANMSSDSQFSCTATFSARREITTVDSSGNEQTMIPGAIGGLVPILQTYSITKSEANGTYVVTLSSVGSARGPTFQLSHPYSHTVTGPVW